MKKLFSFVAVLLLAGVTANATILWEETFDKNGSTYVEKNDQGYWPYAGGDPSKNYVFQNYSTEYTSVESYNCSVRSKKLNGGDQSTPGFYFAKEKEAAKCYLTLEYSFVEEGAGNFLVFEVSSDQSIKDADFSKMAVKVNDAAVEVPATAFPAKGNTATISIELPAGAIGKLHWEFDNLGQQVFLSRPRITDGPEAIENVFFGGSKATKVMENGQMIIIRNGVKYNATGAVVE